MRKEPLPGEGLPAAVTELYARSLLVLKLHGDWQGGIVAANDSDVVLYNRDTYSYVWPRDGALAAQAFDSAGYPFTAQLFYEFAARAISREGYLLHKYNPDGTLASSWHPWFDRGRAQLPIQEDGTALVLWALWHHFVRYRDIDFIKPLYKPLVKTAADFLCSYLDPATGLPAALLRPLGGAAGHLQLHRRRRLRRPHGGGALLPGLRRDRAGAALLPVRHGDPRGGVENTCGGRTSGASAAASR